MHHITKKVFLLGVLFCLGMQLFAQNDSIPNKNLTAIQEIFSARYPKVYTIAGITVKGIKYFDENLIVSITGMSVGDKIQLPGSDAFSKAISKLWKQNIASSVDIGITKVVGNEIYIEISINERPKLVSFSFEGVKKSEREDLESKCGLFKDRVVTENMKLSALEAIRKYYFEKGYRKIDIQTQEVVVDGITNGVALSFKINKGKKVRINSINFSGNEQIDDAILKKQMKETHEMWRCTLYPQVSSNPYGDSVKNKTFKQFLNERAYFYPTKILDYLNPYLRIKFLTSSKFSDTKYQDDKDKIIEYYNSQGLRDAMIVADTQILNQKGNLDIDIKLHEGKRYYFGNISWRGNTKYSDSVLNFLLGIQKGDIYNLELLNKRLGKQLSMEGGDISSLYLDDGYLFFRLDPVETSVYNDTIDFEIKMSEGPQATYGKITVSGNDKTKDYVILREMRTLPGEKFSRADIIRTQRELSQLGFFNPEKISPNIVPNQSNGTVDINWEVEEKSSDQLELSAGYGGGFGLTGTLGVVFNNFSIKNITKKSTWDPLPSGDGQKLSLRISSNGKVYQSYSFSFTEPWLGGKRRNSFSIGYNYSKYNNFNFIDANANSLESYIQTNSIDLSLGKQLKWPDDYFNIIYSLRFQQYVLKNYNQFFSGISNMTSNNVSMKVSLLRNSAGPNPIFPTNGSNFDLSCQFTLPYSLLGMASGSENKYELPEFHKWRFAGDWYTAIGKARGEEKNKQFILRTAVKFGFIGRYNSKLDVSPFERFQVGDAGLNSVSQGMGVFGYDIVSQRGYPVYSSSDPKFNPENANSSDRFTIFNKYLLELRYPFSTSASSTIYGLAFFEAANGWYTFKDYNPFKLRRSVGVGMRFMIPMLGLLGFDYGIGIDRINQNTNINGAARFTFMLGQESD